MVSKEDLSFDHITRSIQFGNFMNLYNLPYSSKRAPKVDATSEAPAEVDPNPNKRKRGEKERKKQRGTRVVNSFSGTQTSMPIRKFMQGRKKYDADFSKCPKVAGKDVCLKWFQRGQCSSECTRKETHIELVGGNLQKVKNYIKACEDAANEENASTQG